MMNIVMIGLVIVLTMKNKAYKGLLNEYEDLQNAYEELLDELIKKEMTKRDIFSLIDEVIENRR